MTTVINIILTDDKQVWRAPDRLVHDGVMIVSDFNEDLPKHNGDYLAICAIRGVDISLFRNFLRRGIHGEVIFVMWEMTLTDNELPTLMSDGDDRQNVFTLQMPNLGYDITASSADAPSLTSYASRLGTAIRNSRVDIVDIYDFQMPYLAVTVELLGYGDCPNAASVLSGESLALFTLIQRKYPKRAIAWAAQYLELALSRGDRLYAPCDNTDHNEIIRLAVGKDNYAKMLGGARLVAAAASIEDPLSSAALKSYMSSVPKPIGVERNQEWRHE